jgi:hypothetical protein
MAGQPGAIGAEVAEPAESLALHRTIMLQRQNDRYHPSYLQSLPALHTSRSIANCMS